eukprot:13808595-Ditylum_brightwellii.AAC.1
MSTYSNNLSKLVARLDQSLSSSHKDNISIISGGFVWDKKVPNKAVSELVPDDSLLEVLFVD